jgi:hypothetical protein
LLEASWEFGLEVNTEKTEYMVLSRHQNAGQSHTLLIKNKSFKNLAKFKYLRKTVSHQDCIHEEIKEQNTFGECLLPFCSESFSSRPLPKNLILPVVLYGCEIFLSL